MKAAGQLETVFKGHSWCELLGVSEQYTYRIPSDGGMTTPHKPCLTIAHVAIGTQAW